MDSMNTLPLNVPVDEAELRGFVKAFKVFADAEIKRLRADKDIFENLNAVGTISALVTQLEAQVVTRANKELDAILGV
jgi:hypothetical protein